MTPPMPIDLAQWGGTVVESARLRERHVLPFVVDAMVLIEDALRRTADYAPTVRPAQPGVVAWPKPSALSHLMALHAIRVCGKPDLLEDRRTARPTIIRYHSSVRGDAPSAALAA